MEYKQNIVPRKTAEEIMQEHVDPHCFAHKNCYEAHLKAMEEYAKQEALSFAKWLLKDLDYKLFQKSK